MGINLFLIRCYKLRPPVVGFYLFLRKGCSSAFVRPLALKLEWAAESPQGLVETQLLGPTTSF